MAAGTLEQLVAGALGVAADSIADETSFRSIPEWDSLGHVELMLALEEAWGIEIGPGLVTELTSVGAIRSFRAGRRGGRSAEVGQTAPPDDDLRRGLSGVYLDETRISAIDGERGRLSYRGYSIDDLVASSTFEETAYLLLAGQLPSPDELAAFSAVIREARVVPAEVHSVLEQLRGARPVDALRTGLSGLGALAGAEAEAEPTAVGARLLGQAAALLAEHHALRPGPARPAPSAGDGAGFAEWLLERLSGRSPGRHEVEFFDRCLILLAEHGSNASAFAGRVAMGTGADLYAALSAAIGTFGGPLHGGAIEGVDAMIEQIGEPKRAGEWIAAQRARRQPVFGFGHRLYRTEDPRAPHLRGMAEELSAGDEDRALEIIAALRAEMATHARLGVDVNVDLYAGVVFGRLAIPADLFISVFAVSRTSGWVAHALEQRRNNVLIRPLLRYAGETNRVYVPMSERETAVQQPGGARAAVTGGPAGPAGRLHSRFIEHAARAPHAPALRIGERTWTYGQIDGDARRWARALLDVGGGRVERVGVFGAQGAVPYAGVLAALYAGAAFVPLSPEMPDARTAAMVRAARLDALITDQSLAARLPAVLGDARVPVLLPDGSSGDAPAGLSALGRHELSAMAPLRRLPEVEESATAYLLFTSGSTGQPKGVPISHANVVHFVDVNLRRYGFTSADRFSQTFQLTFDLSVFDQFMAWGSGGTLCVPQPIDLLAPFRYVAQHGVSVWFSVPSLASLLRRKGLLAEGTLPSLRWSLFCGEALPAATAEAWLRAAPNSTLENLYGPTECTIACTAYRWRGEQSAAESVNGIVPIGRPWPGVEALVVDDGERPVAAGQTGQLAVGGRQTFAGYWQQPDATRRAFFEYDGRRFYRTGDRVVTLPSGDLAFIGRLDQQVQVMGHRVELGEVEAALRARPGVTDAVALAWRPNAASAEGVTAFVAGHALDGELLAVAVRQQLPPYMAPRAVHVLPEFPRNASGKVDRLALARLAED